MRPETYAAHARAEGAAIARAAEGHLEDRVPGCPDYDVGSLLLHTGAFGRQIGLVVPAGEYVEPSFDDVGDDPIDWHRRGMAELSDALGEVAPDRITWTWAGDRPALFWFRRAAQELAVHRWDVESASGEPSPIDTELAVDGIDEFAEHFVGAF